jgi:hypothetical protein
VKPNLKSVTLACADTTARVDLAVRAMAQSLEQCRFGDVKLFTHDASLPFAVKIPRLEGIEAYSNFCIRDLHEYLQTDHVLIVQYDGYVLNGSAWSDAFLDYDYLGAPWAMNQVVGNGGFSLRSARLLSAAAELPGSAHPEDNFLCRIHRQSLLEQGLKFAPFEVARRFAVEGCSFVFPERNWTGNGLKWEGQFGFHSYLTPLPGISDRPRVFHHSGDLGDVIYSLATIKALGGGVLFLSPDTRFPFPSRPRLRMDQSGADTYIPLIEAQPYIWQCRYTGALPHSTDHDLNQFRLAYQNKSPDNFESLYHLHAKPLGVKLDESPWLSVDKRLAVTGRPIAIARSPRYQNPHFPWRHLIDTHRGEMFFVGVEADYQAFRRLIGRDCPPWVPTGNLLELARLIAGARVFIGNQSAPMAVALGLGKNVIQECWQGNPNCLFPTRKNAIFWGVDSTADNLEIPETWLSYPP